MINGQNVLVAVSSYMGLNIEDALVINQDFVNRGGFQSLIKKCFKIKKKPKETFEKIPKNFDIIGKNEIMLIKINLNGKKTVYRNEMSASIRIIDIIVNKNDVYWVQECIHKIEIGDKLSTRSGQKGVVGAIVQSCDLIYNRYGEAPDLIINPCHLPSRMSISQLLESFFGLRAIIKGCRLNDIEKVVYDYKNNQGKEYFWCGKTGKEIKNKIFFGPVFYMPLHHLSYKKCRARNTGFCDTLTGQPLKTGKALRIGEMERDSIIARGQNEILYERFSYDFQMVSVCQNCGLLEPNFKCCTNQKIVRITMSKTTVLMLYELYAQNIFPKLHIKNV
jgi:DNA-directed RNA polymerase beta subunit